MVNKFHLTTNAIFYSRIISLDARNLNVSTIISTVRSATYYTSQPLLF